MKHITRCPNSACVAAKQSNAETASKPASTGSNSPSSRPIRPSRLFVSRFDRSFPSIDRDLLLGGRLCFNMTPSRRMTGWSQIVCALGLVVLMCSASEARPANLGQIEPKPNPICDVCLEFSIEAQMILSDPETQKQAVDLITQMACQSLTPRLKIKCVDLVNVYVPDALIALQAYLGPEICTETGLCRPDSTFSSTSSQGKLMDLTRGNWMDLTPVADTKTCVICQDFAKDALTYLGSNATKSKIIVALHHACSKLEDISKQCDLLVDVYAPDFMEHLDNISPEQFCEMTRLCKPMRKPAHAVGTVKRNDCAICQFVVLELKVKLKDPLTQQRLLEVLLNGCNRVQNHVDECKLIVGQYAPFILANLDTILDADTLCTKVKACQSHNVEAVEPVLALYSEGRTHHHHVHSL